MKVLPATGTAAFLEKISPHIPDDLIDSLFAHRCSRGRPQRFSPSQLFRVSLLPLLTPARSYNLVVSLLGEQRPLRSFARLRNRMAIPDVRMLHEFRERMDLAKLRRLNVSLLRPLLDGAGKFAKTVALIDSTDLPAATNGYKKFLGPILCSSGSIGARSPQRRSEPILRRIQKAHLATLAPPAFFFDFAGSP